MANAAQSKDASAPSALDDAVYATKLADIAKRSGPWFDDHRRRPWVAPAHEYRLSAPDKLSIRLRALIGRTPAATWLLQDALRNRVMSGGDGDARRQVVLSPAALAVDRRLSRALAAMCREAAGMRMRARGDVDSGPSRLVVARMPRVASANAVMRKLLGMLGDDSVPRADEEACALARCERLAERRIAPIAPIRIDADLRADPKADAVKWANPRFAVPLSMWLHASGNAFARGADLSHWLDCLPSSELAYSDPLMVCHGLA
ncbi:hypothetical protein [Cupriavidus sp. UME77]|uniref:hypothetical protein n=1 Tax=Cupriavidus sp. UME77 TaxID=1862321 RepID=UPI001600854D|nr:hypothetical protein [Cupriavidus sp. UME77]MBB1632460.1 hypothetical protein [Cupriavidus sp. UME77]